MAGDCRFIITVKLYEFSGADAISGITDICPIDVVLSIMNAKVIVRGDKIDWINFDEKSLASINTLC
ncbi:hypothetical protein Thiowin_03815 [Thiorhodovibrio winogradskyi]|uniref:Uncharacterized protein n=1 Tax=Thiorhodovibrio winogradskyi TaxID=77007 RepID=A0ABZ0SE25_9GAMM